MGQVLAWFVVFSFLLSNGTPISAGAINPAKPSGTTLSNQSPSNSQGATIIVNTFLDDVVNNNNCTLREAVIATNTDQSVDQCPAGSGADTIILPSGTYTLTVAGSNEDAAFTGDLDLLADLTISGGSPQTTIIEGSGLERIFHIPAEQPVIWITGLTLRNGFGIDAGSGGGIYNQGRLTISNSIIRDNQAWDAVAGGGIYNTGVLTLTNSLVQANSASPYGNGGGLANLGTATIRGSLFSANYGGGGGNIHNQATLHIENSTIEKSGTRFGGGGMFLEKGEVTLVGSTIQGNYARYAAGIFLSGGSLLIRDSTISDNWTDSSAPAGLLQTSGILTVTNSTFSNNFFDSGGSGGGALMITGGQADLNAITVTGNKTDYEDGSGGLVALGGKVNIRNSLIAGNLASFVPQHPDCFSAPGSLVSLGSNLVGMSDGCNWVLAPGDELGWSSSPLDPHLASLADNGGPTRTHALLAGSPALDGAGTGDCPATDQRGVVRPQGTACDIGAYEALLVSVRNAFIQEQDSGISTMVFTVTLSGPSPQEVSFSYATADSTATAGKDYMAQNGTLTFVPGTQIQQINIPVMGDTWFEGNEIFTISLSSAQNAILGQAEATGLIIDAPPRLYLPLMNGG